MESTREIDKVIEREINKGSIPIRFDRLEICKDAYHEITSQEKLRQVLSYLLRIGEYEQFAGKGVRNNVYMGMQGKKVVFKRTKFLHERNSIFATIKRLEKKLKPEYGGKTYLETVKCYFIVPEETLGKCQYNYNGTDTYAFLLSDKMILALYTYCAIYRKEAAFEETVTSAFSGREEEMVALKIVREVLFQTLILDVVKLEEGRICAKLHTIYLLE